MTFPNGGSWEDLQAPSLRDAWTIEWTVGGRAHRSQVLGRAALDGISRLPRSRFAPSASGRALEEKRAPGDALFDSLVRTSMASALKARAMAPVFSYERAGPRIVGPIPWPVWPMPKGPWSLIVDRIVAIPWDGYELVLGVRNQIDAVTAGE